MKHLYLTILLAYMLLPACVNNAADTSTADLARITPSAITSAKDRFLWPLDSAEYEKFQHFDYFTLKGSGAVTTEPFVYVKRTPDKIILRTSDSVSAPHILRKADRYWYETRVIEQHMVYAFPSLNVMRFICSNDTVYEYIQKLSYYYPPKDSSFYYYYFYDFYGKPEENPCKNSICIHTKSDYECVYFDSDTIVEFNDTIFDFIKKIAIDSVNNPHFTNQYKKFYKGTKYPHTAYDEEYLDEYSEPGKLTPTIAPLYIFGDGSYIKELLGYE